MDCVLLLKKLKNNLYLLTECPKSTFVAESFTLIKIPEHERKTLLSLRWLENDTITSTGFVERYMNDTCQHIEVIKTYFNEKAKNLDKDLVKTNNVYTKKIISNVVGTSCLIRTSDRSKISIARRKPGKFQDETRINRVCIDDLTRNKFFQDVKVVKCGDPGKGGYYLSSGMLLFDRWNKLMDEMFLQQISNK